MTTKSVALISGVVTLAAMFFLFRAVGNQSVPSSASAAVSPEPCSVSGDAEFRDGSETLCSTGLFASIHVSANARTVSILMQLSAVGIRAWQANQDALLRQTRRVVDGMVAETHANVAASLFDSGGQMVGGCVRHRGDSQALCNPIK